MFQAIMRQIMEHTKNVYIKIKDRPYQIITMHLSFFDRLDRFTHHSAFPKKKTNQTSSKIPVLPIIEAKGNNKTQESGRKRRPKKCILEKKRNTKQEIKITISIYEVKNEDYESR